MGEALLFVRQLVREVDDVLRFGCRVTVGRVKLDDLLFGVSPEEDDRSADLLHQPASAD